ncbi:MAG: lysophospholipid acyltransferase family protein [Pseudomonadota bacterium]
MKRLLEHDLAQRVLARIAWAFVRLVAVTGRWRRTGGEAVERLAADGQPFIACFWHGRMLMMPEYWRNRAPISMLISEHTDGRLISRAIAHFGVRTITGSTSSGGTESLRAMVRTLKSGEAVGVTPDGPRGPRMRLAPGVLIAAKLARVPIVPATFSSTRAVVLDSWDRFLLALPFGRGEFVVGEPLLVPPDADDAGLEAARRTLEARLNAITAAADEMCGRVPIEPGGPTARPAAAPAPRKKPRQRERA